MRTSLDTIKTELLRLKWQLAALRFERALRRHLLTLKAYNPEQPRDELGKWTSGGGSGSGVRLAASDGPRLGPKSKLGLALELGRQAIKLFRDQNYLYNLFGQKEGTVSYTNVNGTDIYGVNSGSPEYRDRDMIAAEELRSNLMAKYPPDRVLGNVGERPYDAVFHAESTALLRAKEANGGSLEGMGLEVHVDRPMCPSCNTLLPRIGLELGDPVVTFISPSGLTKTMHGGAWIK